MGKFYKTTISIEILSEDGEYDFDSIEQLAYDISEGEFVGTSGIINSVELTSKEMADALYNAGSIPEFFELDDDGKEIES